MPIYEKNIWHHIKKIDGIEYRWRLLKNLTYEVIAVVFEDKNLIAKYAKIRYGSYTANQIFDAAYRYRSAFSHGDKCNYAQIEEMVYIKYVVLNVIKGYMLEMDKTDV